MVDIQILTNSPNQENVKTYWKWYNPETLEYEDTTLANLIYQWTVKFYPSDADPMPEAVNFGLIPFQDFQEFQCVIAEGESRYTLSHDQTYEARTEITFDIYHKSQNLAAGQIKLEMLLAEIQSLWMNYQNHSINGLETMFLNDRYVDTDLVRQSRTSNYKKSVMFIALYYIQRTTVPEEISPEYDNPDIAGAFRIN